MRIGIEFKIRYLQVNQVKFSYEVTHHKYQMIRFDFARHCYSYRQLLNAWKLWFQRAKFDIAMKSSTSQERPPAQIHISCHFCGKSISASMQGLSRTRVPFGRLGSTPNKLKVDFYSFLLFS